MVADAFVGSDVHVSEYGAIGSKIVGSDNEQRCKPGVCVNADLNISLACSPVCGPSPVMNHVIPEKPSPSMAGPLWSSLFTKMPINAGVHSSRSFDNVEINGVMIPPNEVIETVVDYWKEFLVGFFLDSNRPYHLIKAKMQSGLEA